MAEIQPLRAIRYDAEKVGGLSRVVAPPYDVIPDAQLPELRARSPYNVVRLTRPGEDYAGAAQLLEQWLGSGILAQEDEPTLWVHEVRYDGRRRRDLVGALHLEPYEYRKVLPHERTHRGPKRDRLALLRATRMSLEPLWFLYEGRTGELPALLDEAEAATPTSEFQAHEGTRHRLWRIADQRWQRRVQQALAGNPVLIADGHHRYETALAFSEELGGANDASSRYTLALLTDLDDPGLTVLPTHRLLKAGVAVSGGEPRPTLDETLEALEGQSAAGYYHGGEFQVLPLEGEIPVVELHRQVIENILGKRSLEETVEYTRDAEEAVRWVDEGRGTAAFFLAKPDLAAVLKAARSGTTMPQKTTYFYPKPPSGMLFLRLDPERRL
jgi:uncharacterized protein (DUF1015 family)